MKKLLLVFVSLLFSFSAFAQYKEGVDYIVVDRPEEKRTIYEVFSVYCNFCYKYEAGVLPALEKALPSDVKLNSKHLANKGAYGETASKLLAALKATDMDKYQKAKMYYYEAINKNKYKFKDEAEFLNLGLKAAGIDKATYEASLATAEAQAFLAYWDDALEIAEVQGTPAFVVNNKYIIQTSGIKSQDGLNKLVNYLLEK